MQHKGLSDLPPVLFHRPLSISTPRAKRSGWFEELWLLAGKEKSEKAKERGKIVIEQSTGILCGYGDTHWSRVH